MDNTIRNAKLADLIQQSPTVNPVTTSTSPVATPQTNDFEAILADRLKVSGHAQTRLQSRNIELDGDQWERVLQGVDKAAAKGAKESLVMIDNAALVVSVKNRTVITAVDQEHLKENVFTNIDSAVIV